MQRWLLWAATGLAVPALLAGCRAEPTPQNPVKRKTHRPARSRPSERTQDATDEAVPASTDEAPSPWRITAVCIDPGHGGSDSGVEAGGVTEKTITLDIALRVRDKLESQGLGVVITRETDRAVSRAARAAISNHAFGRGAGLFLSIHCNGFGDAGVAGVEVYYLGKGASPEAARLATLMHDTLVGALDEHDRGVRPTGFTVLAETKCPAVLVEVGYLSNAGDRARLLDEKGRQTIADALAAAVVKFASKDGQAPETAGAAVGTGTE